ncbi:MAG: LytTR family DNA-binding domain-containing protein [Burkholderiaceae bacterium]
MIRKTIRELADELDPDRFAQVHRSVIVNLHRVAEVVRAARGVSAALNACLAHC